MGGTSVVPEPVQRKPGRLEGCVTRAGDLQIRKVRHTLTCDEHTFLPAFDRASETCRSPDAT
jgi:hypothetical protein